MKCCTAGDQACRADLSCSDQQYQDKFQALFKTCHTNYRPKACGNPNVIQIDKASSNNKTIIDVDKMGLDDGCTFKVFSKCSWPKLVANTSDVDILVASFSGGADGNDDIADNKWAVAPKSKNQTTATPPDNLKGTDCKK